MTDSTRAPRHGPGNGPMTPEVIASTCRELVLACWRVAQHFDDPAGRDIAAIAADDLNRADWAITFSEGGVDSACESVMRALHTLGHYVEYVIHHKGIDSWPARLWCEVADTAEDLLQQLTYDYSINPGDTCRDPHLHLDYVDAALQVPDNLVDHWRTLTETHSPSAALQLIGAQGST